MTPRLEVRRNPAVHYGPARHRHPHTLHDLSARLHPEPWRRVDIGQVAASREALRLETLLGSCVAVCLYDPLAEAGGMNHILVPTSYSDGCGARCGVQAMELLINAVMKHGGDRRRLVAKAFGAGNVLPVFQRPTVGEMNARFVREFLRTERIPLISERLGGEQAVRVSFHTDSGRAVVRTVDGSRLEQLIREEDRYFHTANTERFPIEEPTIF